MMVDITTEQAGARDVEAGWCGHRGQGQGLCNWQTGRFLEIQEYRAVQKIKDEKKFQEKFKFLQLTNRWVLENRKTELFTKNNMRKKIQENANIKFNGRASIK